MPFTTTALKVLVMLAYAVPGFLFIKLKALKADSISAFAKMLMYVCQPCLQIYSFNKIAARADELAAPMGIFFLASLAGQALILFLLYLIFKRKFASDGAYRVVCIAGLFGNIGFFGTPLLEALLPDYPEAVAYTAVFIVSMNMLAWTAGIVILTGQRKYMSFKSLVLNPPVLALIVALPLFLTSTELPEIIASPIELLGRMSLPICMFVLGMRLATVTLRELSGDKKVLISAAVKLLVMPLAALGALSLLPVPNELRATVVILCACPTAALVQSLGEIYSTGQKTAANAVIVCNILCAVTIPLICLLL